MQFSSLQAQTQVQTNVAHYQFSHRQTMEEMSSEPKITQK